MTRSSGISRITHVAGPRLDGEARDARARRDWLVTELELRNAKQARLNSILLPLIGSKVNVNQKEEKGKDTEARAERDMAAKAKEREKDTEAKEYMVWI